MSEDKIKYKKDLPMNILVCGIEIKENYILSLFNDKVKKNCKYINDFKYTEYKYSYGWKFQFFNEGLEKKNLNNIYNKIRNDFKNMSNPTKKDSLENTFKDTIVCFIGDSLEKAKEVITFFSEIKVIYHTFITFITTNKEITTKVLKDFIDKDLENEFDNRNIDVIQYNDNDRLPVPLFNSLFYKSCYFNEVGNELILPDLQLNSNEIEMNIKKSNCFNFLIIGKPGTGKSTLINILNGGKVAKEGTGGGKVTYNICKYTVKTNENIILYDTPGFGQNKELQKVEEYIHKEITSMKEIKEKFHCVVYMLNYQEERSFDESEINIINTLLDLNIPFYFTLNKSQRPKENKRKKKKRDDKKNILEEEIKNKFPKKIKSIKVISLNLKVNDNDDCFGLDLLFNDLYNYYANYKIDLNKLESFSENRVNTRELIKNSPFFENLLSKEEILDSIQTKCKKEVAAFSLAASAVGFIPIPMSDWPLLIAIQGSMIIAIASEFGKSLKKTEATDLIKSLSKSVSLGALIAGGGKIVGSIIKLFPGIGSVIGGAISGGTAGLGTVSLGLAAISFFSPKFDSKEVFNYFYRRAKTYNNTIDKFKEYADLFAKSDDYMYVLSP